MEQAGDVIYPGSTDVTLIVAVTLGVALPILLAVIIVVVCLRRDHNKRKDNKPHRPPSAIELEGNASLFILMSPQIKICGYCSFNRFLFTFQFK